VRDQWLRSQGFQILPYWNNEIFDEWDAIAEAIWKVAERNPSPPDPSPARGEGGMTVGSLPCSPPFPTSGRPVVVQSFPMAEAKNYFIHSTGGPGIAYQQARAESLPSADRPRRGVDASVVVVSLDNVPVPFAVAMRPASRLVYAKAPT
jgi:hypothetical protein